MVLALCRCFQLSRSCQWLGVLHWVPSPCLVRIFCLGAAHGALLSLQCPQHPCTRVQVLLPKPSRQWGSDNSCSSHPLAWHCCASHAFLCAHVPMPVCMSTPMAVCEPVRAHGHVCAWLQAIPLSTDVPSRAPVGTGRALDMEWGTGSPGQLPLGQPSREAAVWQPPVHASVVGWCHPAMGAGAGGSTAVLSAPCWAPYPTLGLVLGTLSTPVPCAGHPILGCLPRPWDSASFCHLPPSAPPQLAELPGMAPHPPPGSASAFPRPHWCYCTSRCISWWVNNTQPQPQHVAGTREQPVLLLRQPACGLLRCCESNPGLHRAERGPDGSVFLGEGCQVLGAAGCAFRPVPVWKGPFSGLRKCSKKHILALPLRGLVPSLARSCLSFASSAREFPPKLTAQAVFLPAAQPWASLRQLQPWQNGWQSPGGSQTSLELLP